MNKIIAIKYVKVEIPPKNEQGERKIERMRINLQVKHSG